jgi:hypothetical protein
LLLGIGGGGGRNKLFGVVCALCTARNNSASILCVIIIIAIVIISLILVVKDGRTLVNLEAEDPGNVYSGRFLRHNFGITGKKEVREGSTKVSTVGVAMAGVLGIVDVLRTRKLIIGLNKECVWRWCSVRHLKQSRSLAIHILQEYTDQVSWNQFK